MGLRARCCLPALLSIIILAYSASAKEYTVGDSSGWNVGVDYTTWASHYTFNTGDSLKFSYSTAHSVQQVSAEDYKACNSANALLSGTSGTTVVKLDKAQTYYFICGVPGHCEGGMQLSVKVIDGATSKAAPSPTSVPTNHTTPSATSTPTTTSPTSPIVSPPSSPSTPKSSAPSSSSPLLHASFAFFISYFVCLLLSAFTINFFA